MKLHEFVKYQRSKAKLTQVELAQKAGVGLRFLRELERGKATVRLDTVNQVLSLFGYETGAVPQDRSEFESSVYSSLTQTKRK
jgi:y4mF family transcriptional regulator